MSEDYKILSQGDVCFLPTHLFSQEYLAKFNTLKKDNVIAYGEVSNHSHRVIGDAEIFISDEVKGVVTEMLIRVKEKALINHQEHESFPIVGDYIAVIQQEVDHFEKTLKRVSD